MEGRGDPSLDEAIPAVNGVWLTRSDPRAPIDALLLELLGPAVPAEPLRRALLEELERPVRRLAVALELLGLEGIGRDAGGERPLVVVSPRGSAAGPARDPWQEALTRPGGDCPLGFAIDTADAGRVVLVHHVFTDLGADEQALVRRAAAHAGRGDPHARVLEHLAAESGGPEAVARILASARRQVLGLDPSVLYSADGTIRVQLGSLSETTRNLLHEGLGSEALVILPRALFADRTNYADVEFIVYLNFFVRERRRVRIAGTARQGAVLQRLLTLTLFGPFDPAAPLPAFEEVQAAYGVADRETYELFRLAHELYAAREGDHPAGPVLGVDRYVDFQPLAEAGESVIHVARAGRAPTEVRVTPVERGVHVRIAPPDGPATVKTLAISSPRRPLREIPDDLGAAVRFSTERPRFGITPLGTSHGFDPDGDFTSFIIWIGGKGILVDPSPEAPAYLGRMGVAAVDVPYVLLTHVHADHDGGLLRTLLGGSRMTVLASTPVFRAFAEKARLVTGHDFEREHLVTHHPVEPGAPVTFEMGGEVVTIETRWNLHPIPTNGFRVRVDGRVFGYSGDTQYDPDLIARLRQAGRLTARQAEDLLHWLWTVGGEPTVDLLYHEAGIPPIHTDKAILAGLPDGVRRLTRLVHIADAEVPADFPLRKPGLFTTDVLLAPTSASRAQALLEALRLVGYFYDLPPATLETLVRGATLRRYAAGDTIVRRGRVDADEPFFYVLVDGEVAVRDGRRVVGTLVKGDTFGEWGISHEGGFRVADVAATGPVECLQLTQAQYRWLVERHPVVDERVNRIRLLLPRLKHARALSRLKTEIGLTSGAGVLELMTESQLASVALFGDLRAFRAGDAVLVEGDEADGFYVLLSGHLVTRVDGRPAAWLTEGEIFGEAGFLEGRPRSATIVVVSPVAEVLFMSTRNFESLLHLAPAFAWGIREVAAARRADPAQRPGQAR